MGVSERMCVTRVKYPFLNFSILDYSVPYRIVTWEGKIGYSYEQEEEKGKHRLIFKIYRPYKIAYQPEFQIGLKQEKEIVIYALSKYRVDIRTIEHGIHRLATLSDSLNFLGTASHKFLKKVIQSIRNFNMRMSDYLLLGMKLYLSIINENCFQRG
ncbi:MAG: hypothetical protein MUW51_11400 [Lactococcus lactis]|nr:hypothetical protein [Lactococcus lactis]